MEHWSDIDTDIDTTFDFRTDTPVGEDPDRFSPTLRRYHRLLWSKPLPSGATFDLDDSLHHQSALGEFFLSSDAVIPTYAHWASAPVRALVAQLPPHEVADFQRVGYTMGAMMVFPSTQVDRLWTINQGRGMLRATIGDRFDLTLECIRRHYLGHPSPLTAVLARYRDFFELFGDFRGYVEFFLLQDLVADDGSAVRFFLPFADFKTPAVPQSVAEYRGYRVNSIAFVAARNERIDSACG